MSQRLAMALAHEQVMRVGSNGKRRVPELEELLVHGLQ
jgi:hypothetical protein